MTKNNRNDKARREWILADESLYRWFRSYRFTQSVTLHKHGIGIRSFISENRSQIDSVINERKAR